MITTLKLMYILMIIFFLYKNVLRLEDQGVTLNDDLKKKLKKLNRIT